MSKILPDKEIKKLIGSVLIDAHENLLNPNGIELRIGKYVFFHSTSEEKELIQNHFLKISPGENIIISSMEKIDFSPQTVHKIFPEHLLMAFITPTTTMMREGISQVSTKIDAGFTGMLNWGIRNNSVKDIIIEYGEPIFKLTIFLLEKDETPEVVYGEKTEDTYQNTNGIKRSTRRIPADIPKNKFITSDIEKFDPKQQLREAGHPFNYIGTELIKLHGQFEVVSNSVIAIKDEFDKKTDELSQKIEKETDSLSKKMEDLSTRFFLHVESVFAKKFYGIVAILIGAIPILYAGINYLQSKNVQAGIILFFAIIFAIIVLLIVAFINRKIK
jgi:deoxycytidine triphosphate deaminase